MINASFKCTEEHKLACQPKLSNSVQTQVREIKIPVVCAVIPHKVTRLLNILLNSPLMMLTHTHEELPNAVENL